MQVSRWGTSLAVRLPAEIVRKLGLREGDEITLHADESGYAVRGLERPEEVLAALRRFRGRLPARDRIRRDDAHER